MNNLNFTVCSYNIGSSAGDYQHLCKHLNPNHIINNQQEQDLFYSQYDTVQKQTADLLNNKADVYCLQEVGDNARPLIQSLKDRGFKIIHVEGRVFDTAIALHPERFQDITNRSIKVEIDPYFKKDAAIATARDALSGKLITFSSVHAPGFDFTEENPQGTEDGDIYCQAVINKLSEIGHHIQVIGGDMNANPEKWGPRFKMFTDEGFKIHRTGSATNVNPRDKTDQEREIDFIFTKSTPPSIWQKIKSIFLSTIGFNATIKNESSIGWDIQNNASDHLPVFIEVSQQHQTSKIYNLWSATYRLFLSCFGSQQLQTP